MALDVVDDRGRSGRVYVRDDRGPDGATLLLVCEQLPFGRDAVGVPGLGPGVGVALEPEAEPPPRKKTGFILPVDDDVRGLVNLHPPFDLEIDMTGFPSGPHRFNLDQFLRQATKHGVPGDVTTMHLTFENAEEWGWRPPRSHRPTGEELLR